MNNDDTMNLADEINATKSLLESTEKQITTLDRAMQDLSTTLAVLKERDNFTESETRVSIGSGLFLKAKIENSDSVMLPIGSDIYTDTDAETARKKIEANIMELQKSLDSLASRQTDLRVRYENLVAIAQSVSQQELKRQ